MKFFSACAAVMAFAASALAQTADFDPIFTPTSGQVVPAGSTFKITWQAPPKYAGEKITIHLIGGETQNTQVPLLDIAAGIDNSAESYDWAVPADLGAAKFYGLVIKLQRDPSIYQYSNPFQIQAGAGVSSSTTTPATSATSASSTASATTTLTTSEGTKTVTLSSSSTVIKTTSTVSSSTKVTTTDCTTSTIIPQCKNCTATTLTSVSKPPVVLTSTGAVPTKTATTTPPPVVVTAGASRFGAGSVAAVAGLVLAAFAL